MTPGAAFHRAASNALRARGEWRDHAPYARISGVVGETPHRYAEYARGEREPGTAKVEGWLRRWAAAGYDPIALRVGVDGWAVAPAHAGALESLVWAVLRGTRATETATEIAAAFGITFETREGA